MIQKNTLKNNKIKLFFSTTTDLASMDCSRGSWGSSSSVPGTGPQHTTHTLCRSPSCNLLLIDNLKRRDKDKMWQLDTHGVNPLDQKWLNGWQMKTRTLISSLKKGSVTGVLICLKQFSHKDIFRHDSHSAALVLYTLFFFFNWKVCHFCTYTTSHQLGHTFPFNHFLSFSGLFT